MSKELGVQFTCMVCQSENPTRVIKPKPFQPTVAKRECEVCDSQTQLKFSLIPGNKKQVAIQYLRFFVSEKGQEILKAKALENEKTKEELKTELASPIV